jgi:hypothetical protein
MAMMLLPVAEQLSFFRAPAEERAKVVERLRPQMARTWPNFERKHAELQPHHR